MERKKEFNINQKISSDLMRAGNVADVLPEKELIKENYENIENKAKKEMVFSLKKKVVL